MDTNTTAANISTRRALYDKPKQSFLTIHGSYLKFIASSIGGTCRFDGSNPEWYILRVLKSGYPPSNGGVYTYWTYLQTGGHHLKELDSREVNWLDTCILQATNT